NFALAKSPGPRSPRTRVMLDPGYSLAREFRDDRSDHPLRTQGGDIVLAVARLLEDLLGVLAGQRRLALDAAAAVGEAEAGAHEGVLAVSGLDPLQNVAVRELRMLDDLGDRPHARAGNIGRRQPRLPGLGIVGGEHLLDDGTQGLVVGDARRPVDEAGVLGEVRLADGAGERA